MPLPYRWLTSLMTRCEGSSLLIDCGEGTQIAMKEKGWSPKPIDVICFTHYHADHISGLAGLLLTMGNAERYEPLLLIGPKGLERVVSAMRIIAPELPFPIKYKELSEAEESIEIAPYRIEAFKVNHNVLCYGYRIAIDRLGKFHVDKAKELDIPVKYWNKLQHGESVNDGSRLYTPDMVMGEARRGLKVCYTTDTRPTPLIYKYAQDVDLFICEGMYGEEDKDDKARQNKHMTMYEAAQIGRKSKPRRMWLTHYSPSLNRPEEYMDKVRKICPVVKAARDGWSLELEFDNE